MRRVILGGSYQHILKAHLTEDDGVRGTALCGRYFGAFRPPYPAPAENKVCVWCWRVDQGLFTPTVDKERQARWIAGTTPQEQERVSAKLAERVNRRRLKGKWRSP